MKPVTPLVFMALCGALYTVGDIALKKWVQHPSPWPYLLALFMYVLGMNFLAFSYLYRNIAAATSVCVIINVVLLTAVSWAYFKEPLTVRQMIGVGLGVLAVVILET